MECSSPTGSQVLCAHELCIQYLAEQQSGDYPWSPNPLSVLCKDSSPSLIPMPSFQDQEQAGGWGSGLSEPMVDCLSKQVGVQVLSRVQLCNMDCSTPGSTVLHHLLKLAQTHVHWVADAIQPSHLLSSPSPHALNPSQHQSLFQ